MSKETNQLNPYLSLGKLIDNNVDYKEVDDFVKQYLKITEKTGAKPNDIIMKIKNFSNELNDAILNSCVEIQGNLLPEQSISDMTNGRISVKHAAQIYNVTTATIRNWINDKTNPLPALNVGKRQTTILLSDLTKYITTIAKRESRN